MNEKLIEEFLSMGCKSRKNAAMCLQVYLDLCEVKRYWDVKYLYSEALDIMYITCKRSKSAANSTYVPCYISENLSFSRMQKLLTLSTTENEVNLVMISADSTVVYYQIESGIGRPQLENPSTSRDEKRETIDVTLRKHRKLLEQSALYGLAITLPKKTLNKRNKSSNRTDAENTAL